MAEQDQFLDVIDRDEAESQFRAAIELKPLGVGMVSLAEALGRVLARDIRSGVDVPSFDRSNFDGFAVHAGDTFGAMELSPRRVKLLSRSIDAGVKPADVVRHGEAVAIATGGMMPRGADAVLMVEHADVRAGELVIRKAVAPGFGIAFAGSDIAIGETVLRAGAVLTSRETGVLAAIGEATAAVWKRPRVAIISTGDELISPGEPMRPPHVYDSNAQVLADSVRELGGCPRFFGIVRDDVDALRQALQTALAESDVVLLSGGTSKGQGDLCYRVVAELKDPGIVAHGVALKPGKPICLAASAGKPVVILPGFPTSAIFTFHEFVAPVIAILGGRDAERREGAPATMAVKVNSEIGRTEYLLVGLAKSQHGLSAYPMGKGSGSVTAFSRADGFVTIDRHTEIIDAGQQVCVQLIGHGIRPADFIVIGSHCIGLDCLLSRLQERGIKSKSFGVGSSAGLEAARRDDCDIAGIHLLDPATGEYNRAFLSEKLLLVEGYGRRQGIVHRRDDARFEGRTAEEAVKAAVADSTCTMVNRNLGSGTRLLIDRLLNGARPNGYANQPSNHNAVAAAVAQGRADWGVAIDLVTRANDLAFIPYQDERYDFVVPVARRDKPEVQAFIELLREAATRQQLREVGLIVGDSCGRVSSHQDFPFAQGD